MEQEIVIVRALYSIVNVLKSELDGSGATGVSELLGLSASLIELKELEDRLQKINKNSVETE